MSSKFFATGDSSDESEEEVSSQSSSEDEQVQQFTSKLAYESSESEEEKRVIRSQKDKRYDAILIIVKALRNHLKINDWISVQKDFDLLSKEMDKSKSILEKEGIPKFYWKSLVDLDNTIKSITKEAQKKMNANNARAFSTLKQKQKKLMTDKQKEIENYLKDPLAEEESDDESDDEERKQKKKKPAPKKKKEESESESEEESSEEESSEEESDDESEEETKVAKKKPAPKKKKAADSDSEESDSEDSSDESSEESSDDDSDDSDSDDEDLDISQGSAKMFTREFWVKKNKDEDEDLDKKKARAERQKQQQKRAQQNEEERTRAAQDKAKEKTVDWSPELIVKKLKELIASRGKRGTDRMQMIADLQTLSDNAQDPATILKIRTTLAAALFDVTLNKGTHMPLELWKQAYNTIGDILSLLTSNNTVRLSEDEEVEENFEEDEDEIKEEDENEPEDSERAKRRAAQAEAREVRRRRLEDEGAILVDGVQVQYVMGNLYSFLQSLFSEFRKSLQNIDHHTQDYIDRLKDEPDLFALVVRAREYYSLIAKKSFEAKVAMLQLDLVYYHYRPSLDVQKQQLAKERKEEVKEEKIVRAVPITKDLVHNIASFLYKNGDARSRTRALLMHVYHLALHNRYSEARELLLMSHVQDTIGNADVRTQILFNRAMAQMGLAAFRVGEHRHALFCLADLYNPPQGFHFFQPNRVRELLAQGLSLLRHGQERDADKEREEKRRLLPFHMHINLDMLEAVHLLCAMLVEVPNLALHGQHNKKRVVSKAFRRLLDSHLKQAFNGPPENTRDLVMAATKALRTGDWAKCVQFSSQLKFWQLIPERQYVQSLLQRKVQEECLKTYLITFGAQFASLSLDSLQQQFSLPREVVYRLTSKMMVNEQLAGAWDQPTNTIIMQATEPNRYEKAALSFSEKVASFAEQNERLVDQRIGSMNRDENRPQQSQGARSHNRGPQRRQYNQRNNNWNQRRDNQSQSNQK